MLSPKLVGDSVGLHPVWLMFALFAFGYLFGFRRASDRCPARGRDRRAGALCVAAVSRKPVLHRPGAARHGGPGRDRRPRPEQRATQLALALDHGESLAREDFLSGPSNVAALALIERWPDWPSRMVLLRGPEGAGKSHLAAIWAREAGARMLSPRALEGADLPVALATGALVIEDLSRWSIRRGGAVPSAQPGPRTTRLCADHHAERAGSVADRAARSRLPPARVAGGGARAAGRRAAAGGDRQAVRRSAACGRRKPGRLISRPASSARLRRRGRRSPNSTARPCG